VSTARVISEDLDGDQSGWKCKRIVRSQGLIVLFRTRIGYLSYYTGDKARVEEIPTRQLAVKIAIRLTDESFAYMDLRGY